MTGTPEQARGGVTAIFFLNGLLFGEWARASLRSATASASPTASSASCSPAPPSARSSPCRSPAGAPHASAAAAPRASPSRSCAGQRRHRAGAEPARALLAGVLLRRVHGRARRDHERPRRRRRAPLRPRDPGQLPRGLLDRRPRRRRHRRARGGRRPRRARAARDRRGRVGGDRPDVVAALPGRDADAMGRAEPVFVRPPRRLLALGALAFACLLIEGASADWSAVYLRDELGTTAAVAAIGFTAFSVTMTFGRVFGDRLVDRFGPEAIVRAGGSVAAVGFGLALWPPRRCPRSSASPAWVPGCRASCRSSSAPRATCPACPPASGWRRCRAPATWASSSGRRSIGGLAELVGLPGALGVIVALAAAVALLAPHHPLRARRPGRRARAADGGGMTAILSDLDGVLVDSHASIMRAWRWWGAEHGVAAEAIESVQQGRPSGEVIAALVPGPRRRRRVARHRPAPGRRHRRRHRPARRPRALRRHRPGGDRDLVHRAAGHRAPARRRARGARRCSSPPSACRAASPIPRATCSPPASSAPRRRTAWSSRTRRRASRPGAQPACTSSASPRRTTPPSSTPTSWRRRSPPGSRSRDGAPR